MALPEFKDWYASNKSYYAVKHENREDDMQRDAMNAYNTMKVFSNAPMKEPKKGKKKKPNPYGFDND